MTLSYDDSNEEWRYARLAKVAQIMSILDPELQDSISNLHDHEGCLTVTWTNASSMSKEGEDILLGIWELFNECMVAHEIFQP
jgi:hypothetical protein